LYFLNNGDVPKIDLILGGNYRYMNYGSSMKIERKYFNVQFNDKKSLFVFIFIFCFLILLRMIKKKSESQLTLVFQMRILMMSAHASYGIALTAQQCQQ